MSLHSNVAIVATPIVATPIVAAQRCHYYSCTYCRYTKMLLHLLSLHQDVAAYTVATFNVVHTHCRYTKMFALIVARCGFTRPYYGLFAIYSSAAGSQSTHMSPSSPRVMIKNVQCRTRTFLNLLWRISPKKGEFPNDYTRVIACCVPMRIGSVR